MPPNAFRLAAAGPLDTGLHLSPAMAQVPGFLFCAWWVESTATTANIAFPDSNAAHWTTFFQVTPDLRSIPLNVDNKSVGALVQPAPGRLVLVRGQAPSLPPGEQALPWDPAATQRRYWWLCSNIYRRPWPMVVDEVDGQEILGCAADLDTRLDGQGRYTHVVSYPGDKPSAAALAAAGATWLSFSTEQPLARHLLILRNMLGDDFPQSVQNGAAGTDPASIAACAASRGRYYPQAATCRAAVFEQGGPEACLRE